MRFATAALMALLVSCSADKVAVTFEGSDAFSDTKLRGIIAPDLRRYAKGGVLAALDDAAYRLAYHYRLSGFPDAAVDFQIGEKGPIFQIKEGRKVLFGRLGFRGNEAFKDRELRDALPQGLLGGEPPYSLQLLDLVQDEIRSAYLAAGYLDVHLADPILEYDEDDENMDVTLQIGEGKQYLLSSITGVEHPGLMADLSNRIGRPFAPSTPQEIRARAVAFLTENGHPYPRARAIRKVDRDTARVDLELRIRPGPAGRLGDVQVEGLDRVRKSYVEQRADLEKGRTYRRSALRRAEERLEDMHVFRSVRVTPGEVQENGEVPVVITVAERLPFEVSVRGGYGTLEGPLLGAEAAHLNVFGGGETVRLSGSVSSLGTRADLEMSVPFLLGGDFRPAINVYREARRHPSFDATSHGILASLTYPVGKQWNATGGARYAILRTSDVEEGVPTGDLLDFDYLALFVSSSFDRRDNALLPTRGYIVGARMEWAGEAIGSDIDFINVNGHASGFLPLGWGMVGALSVQGGRIAGINHTDEIPIALRYFAGGLSTVRGFEPESLGPKVGDDPTGGEVFASIQAEARIPLWGDLHGAVFSDRGGVWEKAQDIALDDLRYSVGIGVRYLTPAGAIVADVAWNPKREEDEDAIELHFSIGFPF
jgi:outer membrane protein assembly complex protein YaeT